MAKKILLSILKWIGIVLAYPWVALAFIFSFLGALRMARKYAKYPKKVFFEQRFTKVYKLIKKVLFLKQIKITSSSMRSVPFNASMIIFNHKSNLDGLVILKLLYEYRQKYNPEFKFHVIVKHEISKHKSLYSILSLIDTLFIKRDDIRQSIGVYNSEINYLKAKEAIIVSPEGTRIYDDTFGEFKAGAIKPAFDLLIPIQPIVLYGTSGLMDKNKSNKHGRHVYVSFMPVEKPFNFHFNNIEFFSQKLREKMLAEYNNLKKQFCKVKKS